eukprot:gene14976-20147_t
MNFKPTQNALHTLPVQDYERIKKLIERMQPILIDRCHISVIDNESEREGVEKFLFNTFGYEMESHYYAFDTILVFALVISFRLLMNYYINQDGWDKFTQRNSEPFIVIGISAMIFVFAYWLFGGIWTFIDIKFRTQMSKYKIQPNKYPTNDDLIHVAFYVIRSQFLVGGLMLFLYYYSQKSFKLQILGTLPHPLVAVLHIGLNALFFEFWYYFSHRLAHHHKYYKYVHKVHHKYEAPFAIMALYAHPVEEIFINFLPALLCPLLLSSHITILWTWLTLIAFSSTRAHCGYSSPWNTSPRSHDLHHRSPHGNFGQFDILDAFCGTDKLAKATIRKILEKRQEKFNTFNDCSFEEIENDLMEGTYRREKGKIRQLLAHAQLSTEEVSNIIMDLTDFFPTDFLSRIEFACENYLELSNNQLFELFQEDLKYLYPSLATSLSSSTLLSLSRQSSINESESTNNTHEKSE